MDNLNQPAVRAALQLKLGSLALRSPFLLAPMLDITGRAFRQVVRAFGGCGLFYSEMLNAVKVPREKDGAWMYAGFGEERDLMLQLVGNDPAALARAVTSLERFAPAGFDLNLGCSRALIRKKGWGAAMLSNPKATAEAVSAMRRATNRPLSVKLRVAWPNLAAARPFLQMLESEGTDAVIVHPRSPENSFSRPARWEWIGQIKALLRIPVIGNGDVLTPADGLEMMARTGCDGVMIGRGAAANPSLFRDLRSRMLGETPLPAPGHREVMEKVITQFEAEIHIPKRVREFKTFCEYFSRGLPVPHWFWGPLQGLRTGPELLARVRDFFRRYPE